MRSSSLAIVQLTDLVAVPEFATPAIVAGCSVCCAERLMASETAVH